MLKWFTKQEKSWMMYDWANSAHTIVVVTILPIFFLEIFGNNGDAMTKWGQFTSYSKGIIALLAPLLGAIGDFKNVKKRMITLFVAIGVLSCIGLAGVPFNPVWQVVLAFYVISNFAFAGANIYYDGLLTDVTTEERMDKVSAWGFGLGYIGGSTIPFVIFLLLSKFIEMTYAMSISFALTGVWWGIFTIPLLKNVKQIHYIKRRKNAVIDTLKNLWKTMKEIGKIKHLLLFLIAYFFYIDGVNTIIYMSAIYGRTLGLPNEQLMLALLMVQILAFPFAVLYGALAKKYSAELMVLIGIVIYMFITVFGFYVAKVWHFWVIAALVASSQGGIQALSRSMFGKMIPDKKRSNEFFGFYEIFGKFSAIMGPWLFGTVAAIAKNKISENNPGMLDEALDKMSAPYGVLSVLGILIIGAVLYILFMKAKKENTLEQIDT